jgi:hypothetical protein
MSPTTTERRWRGGEGEGEREGIRKRGKRDQERDKVGGREREREREIIKCHKSINVWRQELHVIGW